MHRLPLALLALALFAVPAAHGQTDPCVGELDGTKVQRETHRATETPCVNGVRHGLEISRYCPGFEIPPGSYDAVASDKCSERRTPFVNGRVHGTSVLRHRDGGVTETPFVNGVRHGTETYRGTDGSRSDTPYVDGEKHGTERGVNMWGTSYSTCWNRGRRC